MEGKNKMPLMPKVLDRKYLSPERKLIEEDENVTPEPISKVSLESKIEQFGCMIRGKIVVGDKEDKGYFVRYINASLPDGGTCYIDLDIEGYVSYEEGILPMKEKSGENSIPHSRKVGDLNLTYPDTEGVAFECDSSFVIVTMNQEESKPMEKTYSIDLSEPYDGYLENGAKSYPIIKMSDLNANHKIVTHNASMAYSRLLSRELKVTSLELKQTQNEINLLKESFESVNTKYSETIEAVVRDIKKLEAGYEKFSHGKNYNKNKLERVKYNLKIRKEHLKALFQVMTRINSMREKIYSIRTETESLNKYMVDYFKWIGMEETIKS
jgi:hypothetical protein